MQICIAFYLWFVCAGKGRATDPGVVDDGASAVPGPQRSV
jgi:hypothetical protein